MEHEKRNEKSGIPETKKKPWRDLFTYKAFGLLLIFASWLTQNLFLSVYNDHTVRNQRWTINRAVRQSHQQMLELLFMAEQNSPSPDKKIIAQLAIDCVRQEALMLLSVKAMEASGLLRKNEAKLKAAWEESKRTNNTVSSLGISVTLDPNNLNKLIDFKKEYYLYWISEEPRTLFALDNTLSKALRRKAWSNYIFVLSYIVGAILVAIGYISENHIRIKQVSGK